LSSRVTVSSAWRTDSGRGAFMRACLQALGLVVFVVGSVGRTR
jgi:hypothetical protein